jgi:8-oxo-dGTP pyrophosphatase MutT (NUDIX family)
MVLETRHFYLGWLRYNQAMEKQVKQKVVIYVIKNDQLLVFRHTDYSYEEVGIQVPAGSIKEGETPEEAALRELQEETGYSAFRIVRSLGTSTYDMLPEKPEIHERHFFLAEPTTELPERWNSQEDHDGAQEPTRFECFWIPLELGHILQAGQSALLSKI